MALVIGIDPGKKGGIVALDLNTGFPVEWLAADDPSGGYVAGKHYLDRVMAVFLEDRQDVALCVLERAGARPMEGRTSCFTNGMGFGLWRGMIAALNLPSIRPTPASWQRQIFGTRPAGADRKARAIETAMMRCPDLDLVLKRRRKPHDGLADAACLALFGIAQLGKGAA